MADQRRKVTQSIGRDAAALPPYPDLPSTRP